jgi:hypothetical protein
MKKKKATKPEHQWQIEWVPIESIKPDPLNRNTHPEDQINDLAIGMQLYGWTGSPIVVSKETGLIKAGHARLAAAKIVGLKQVPVHFKSFGPAEVDFGFGVFDNAIAKRSRMDMAGINLDIVTYGPELDITSLGIKGFEVEAADRIDNKTKSIKCPECGHEFKR